MEKASLVAREATVRLVLLLLLLLLFASSSPRSSSVVWWILMADNDVNDPHTRVYNVNVGRASKNEETVHIHMIHLFLAPRIFTNF